jgi:hypothetical protein
MIPKNITKGFLIFCQEKLVLQTASEFNSCETTSVPHILMENCYVI